VRDTEVNDGELRYEAEEVREVDGVNDVESIFWAGNVREVDGVKDVENIFEADEVRVADGVKEEGSEFVAVIVRLNVCDIVDAMSRVCVGVDVSVTVTVADGVAVFVVKVYEDVQEMLREPTGVFVGVRVAKEVGVEEVEWVYVIDEVPWMVDVYVRETPCVSEEEDVAEWVLVGMTVNVAVRVEVVVIVDIVLVDVFVSEKTGLSISLSKPSSTGDLPPIPRERLQ
jgi:hypothetical protein